MKNFMDKDFLLSNEISKKLYHDFSSNMPILAFYNISITFGWNMLPEC